MPGALQLRGRWARASPSALLVATVIALDQVTKHLIRARLLRSESVLEGWPVRITHVENSGSAFGLFTDQTFFLIVASIVAIGIMILLYHQRGGASLLLRIALALQIGGGISNLADRIRYGSVTDFIDLQIWPVFNIADSSIVIGIVLLAWIILFRERSEGTGA